MIRARRERSGTEHLLIGKATGRSLRGLLALRLRLGRGGGED